LIRKSAAAVVSMALFLVCSAVAAGQTLPGSIRGQVIDGSGGVLPGVTVRATAVGGRLLATAVTDGAGGYLLRALPSGPITLTFQLDGFAGVAVPVIVQPGDESRVVERLELAPHSETVIVQAPAPVDAVPPVSPSPPRHAPDVSPVPPHDRDSICGPAKPTALPESLGTIKSRLHATQGALYTTGAELAIDRGADDGLEVGRNLTVRHYYPVRSATSPDTTAEHSAGLLQIVSAGERSSVGVVVYACDEMKAGDFVAAFTPEPIRQPEPVGTPVYDDAARILFADEGQTLGAARRLMVIDRGTAHGTRVGQRFTLFRDVAAAAGERSIIGDAVVVAVRAESATIRIERVTDAVVAGDRAAPQGVTSAARQQ
jgi:hypothetical protein